MLHTNQSAEHRLGVLEVDLHRAEAVLGAPGSTCTTGRLRCRLTRQRAKLLSLQMFPYVALAEGKSWQPGPYAGVELMVLHKNAETGGVVLLRKFHAGQTIPAHTHPQANEWAYVLSGEWEESGVVYRNGALFFAPKGVQHGPHVARTEVVSLTIFDGPLTVV